MISEAWIVSREDHAARLGTQPSHNERNDHRRCKACGDCTRTEREPVGARERGEMGPFDQLGEPTRGLPAVTDPRHLVGETNSERARVRIGDQRSHPQAPSAVAPRLGSLRGGGRGDQPTRQFDSSIHAPIVAGSICVVGREIGGHDSIQELQASSGLGEVSSTPWRSYRDTDDAELGGHASAIAGRPGGGLE